MHFLFSAGSTITFSFPCIQDLITSSAVNIDVAGGSAPFQVFLADGIAFFREMPYMCDANSVEIRQDVH